MKTIIGLSLLVILAALIFVWALASGGDDIRNMYRPLTLKADVELPPGVKVPDFSEAEWVYTSQLTCHDGSALLISLFRDKEFTYLNEETQQEEFIYFEVTKEELGREGNQTVFCTAIGWLDPEHNTVHTYFETDACNHPATGKLMTPMHFTTPKIKKLLRDHGGEKL